MQVKNTNRVQGLFQLAMLDELDRCVVGYNESILVTTLDREYVVLRGKRDNVFSVYGVDEGDVKKLDHGEYPPIISDLNMKIKTERKNF